MVQNENYKLHFIKGERMQKMSNIENKIIKQNEKEANIIVARVMRICSVVFTLVLILNIIGVFIIDMSAMIIAYTVGMILLFIPTLLVNILKNNNKINKYIFVTITAIFVSLLIITFNWHAVVLYILAIGIASMYFSKGVNRYAVIISMIFFAIAQYMAYQFKFTPDLNQNSAYTTIVYSIIPRSLSLFAVSELFIGLNKRTTKMLMSLKNADEQAQMVEQIKNMSENAKKVSSTLTDAVSTLTDVAENSTNRSVNISKSTAQVANGSSETVAQISEVENNIKSISDNLSKLATSTDEISNISFNVKKLTEGNTENMNLVLSEFEKISDSTNHTKEIINGLEDKSQKIMNIIQAITSISSQTNLLAFNASIESARAGEAGKGFAVVAEEIRKLAEQTKDAVGDISNIIEEVVTKTLEAVNSMEENAKLVVTGMDYVKTAENSTILVTSASDEMSGKIEQIDGVTKEVAKNSETIVEIISNIEQISNQNLEDLRIVSNAGERGLKDMERLKDLVENIRIMSEDLNKVINNEA